MLFHNKNLQLWVVITFIKEQPVIQTSNFFWLRRCFLKCYYNHSFNCWLSVFNSPCLFAEPTQIYRFLRTRNLMAVSICVHSASLHEYLSRVICSITPDGFYYFSLFFYCSPYFCTGPLPTCPTATPASAANGKGKKNLFFLLFSLKLLRFHYC